MNSGTNKLLTQTELVRKSVESSDESHHKEVADACARLPGILTPKRGHFGVSTSSCRGGTFSCKRSKKRERLGKFRTRFPAKGGVA